MQNVRGRTSVNLEGIKEAVHDILAFVSVLHHISSIFAFYPSSEAAVIPLAFFSHPDFFRDFMLVKLKGKNKISHFLCCRFHFLQHHLFREPTLE